MRINLLSILLPTLGLAGCAAGPDYVRPDMTVNAGWHEGDALGARHAATPMPALDTWWKGFGDPPLVTIVERVLAQNLDLAASAARVEQARAAANHANADRLPMG